MSGTRIRYDASKFRIAAQAKVVDFRKSMDDAVLYLAASARKRLAEAAKEVFDRPTEFTLSAFAYRLLKGDVPAALVYVMPRQARYLALQVYGGTREPGDFATTNRGIILPGRDAKLDEFGNLPRGEISEAIADGARWTRIEAGGPELLILPGRGRIRVIAVAAQEAEYEIKLPFHDIVERAVMERGPGALEQVLKR